MIDENAVPSNVPWSISSVSDPQIGHILVIAFRSWAHKGTEEEGNCSLWKGQAAPAINALRPDRDKKPTTSTTVQVGPMGFKSRTEAEAGMKTITVCSSN
jgi:hypothetical protein